MNATTTQLEAAARHAIKSRVPTLLDGIKAADESSANVRRIRRQFADLREMALTASNNAVAYTLTRACFELRRELLAESAVWN